MFRKLISILLVITVSFTALSFTGYGEVSGKFGGGTWSSNQQGFRFSIYDTIECRTVNYIDLIASDGYSSFEKAKASGKIDIARGNKLEYMYLYAQGYTISDIVKQIRYTYNDLHHCNKYISDGVLLNKFAAALTPIKTDIDASWCAPQDMRAFLSKEIDAYYVEQLLNYLGFSIYGSSKHTYFEEGYVLVVEPVYWFLNITLSDDLDDFYLYGTATEWALFDQLYFDNQTTFYNSYDNCRGSIHQTMGSLTYLAGPAATMIGKSRSLELGGGTVIEFERSDENIDDLLAFKGAGYDRKATYDWHASVNTTILTNYGAEFITPTELTELSIDIVDDNTMFRTGTDSILSFKVKSSGEIAYTPEYEELLNNPNAYGIRLVLKTHPSSDLKLGTLELTSAGLPASELGDVSTYIFRNFTTPWQQGTWTFTMTAFDANGSKINYTSNNGSYIDDGEYEFMVRFMELPLKYPEDTYAEDKAPSDFEIQDFDIFGNSYTAFDQRVTHTEWHYYIAGTNEKINEEGEEETEVVMFLQTRSADASIPGTYLPKIYNNVETATRINNEYHTRAGYGIGVEVPNVPSNNYFKSGVVLFPEHQYTTYGCKLEYDGNDLVMEKNPYSMYYRDILHSDYSRVHFTPVWYPDGEYKIVVFLYEYWTPAGMLWDYAEYTVHIKGTVYDDWYITRN